LGYYLPCGESEERRFCTPVPLFTRFQRFHFIRPLQPVAAHSRRSTLQIATLKILLRHLGISVTIHVALVLFVPVATRAIARRNNRVRVVRRDFFFGFDLCVQIASIDTGGWMPRRGDTIVPHDTQSPTSIRGTYIQNLTDLLHVCLLRGDTERARRAWSILVSPCYFLFDHLAEDRSDVGKSIGTPSGIGVFCFSKRQAHPARVFELLNLASRKLKAGAGKLNDGSKLFEYQLERSK
jgi:hypothetical protein